MLKISLLYENLQNSREDNSRILRIKNVKFSGDCFYMNTNIYGDFQIFIRVPLKCKKKSHWLLKSSVLNIYSGVFKVNNS